MQTVSAIEQIADLNDNQIIGHCELINSKVIFQGKGNILFINSPNSQKIVLRNSTITFANDNSLAFLNDSPQEYQVQLDLYNNSFCHIGSNNYFNGPLRMQCSEQQNIFIGDNCLFSFGIWLRTSDVHLIYDAESRTRINQSKSVFIGDHVWIGQDAKVWKETQIGSGAILGAGAFSAGKRIPSNTAWGGNPARLIKKDVFFYGINGHPFTDAETAKYAQYPDDRYIYTFDKNETLDFSELERQVLLCPAARGRAYFLIDLSRRKSKNRFYIAHSS